MTKDKISSCKIYVTVTYQFVNALCMWAYSCLGENETWLGLLQKNIIFKSLETHREGLHKPFPPSPKKIITEYTNRAD